MNFNNKNRSPKTRNVFDWHFWLWLLTSYLLVLIVAVSSTAWLVRSAVLDGSRLTKNQKNIVLLVALFPSKVKIAIQDMYLKINGKKMVSEMLIDRSKAEKPSWVRHFPAREDKGYLLISGPDSNSKQPAVKLIRIADGVEKARWQPDFFEINNQMSNKSKGSWINLKAIHPLLLNDGDIIFNTSVSLVRQSICSAKPMWVVNDIAHHSNELDENGDAVWSPTVSHDGFPGNLWLKHNIRDDALGHFSLTGKLLENRSFSNILIENGLGPLLLGTSGTAINDDPIHMNQISVAHSDSRYWRRGDLLISSRNLSTLFLYRPSTNKILWHQTGPWMNQHSAYFVDDHQISIFSNNVVSGSPHKIQSFLSKNEINRVYIFDFDNNKASQPYEKLLAVARPITLTEGRARILPDGGLFIEETNYGRLLRFTKNQLLWTMVNDYDNRRIGKLSWSRYLTAEEASKPLKALAAKHCQENS